MPSYVVPARVPRLHIEKKTHDQLLYAAIGGVGLGQNLVGSFGVGGSQLIHEISRGSASYERVGNEITLKYFQFRGSVSWSGTVANSIASLRMTVYVDKEPASVNPATVNDIFDLSGSKDNEVAISSVYALPLRSARKRFQILYDKVFNYNPSGAYDRNYNPELSPVPWAALPKEVNVAINHNFKGYQSIYKEKNNGGAYDGIENGALCVMFNGADIAPGGCLVQGAFRLKYTDL